MAGTFWPAAFSSRSRFVLMPCSSATRQAGESVSRWVTRTALARSLQRLLHPLEQLLELARPALVLLRFSASPPSLPRSRSPLATDCSGLPSNSCRWRHHPLVDAVVHQQHLDAVLAEDLEVRAVAAPRRSCRR